MYIISVVYSDCTIEEYSFDDLSDCLDYVDLLFSHFSDYHPGVNVTLSFCYKPKEN